MKREVKNDGDRTRLVTEGDGRTRARYTGQGKRGPQSRAQLDDQDLAEIARLVARCTDGLRFVRAQPELGRVQVRDGEHAALAFLHLAIRLGGDVLERNGYETPKGKESDT